ncbi:hypothetical protein [Roseibacillus ishigakijimensis]|uniref:Glycosyl transferase family 2 n=1 Tax=Roseibacillus ishigakijimensis TaxID=454146 RepID=A0A934VN91_9BACT|nr:hypothetical protein [Roseibacillus ishigakijimensis]MBK1835067.1 hypothetical protein [Roseibacillus ishigakijimensis]
MIVVCQTCKGRLHQARQTLPENFVAQEEFRALGGDVLNVVVAYNCPDESENWLQERYEHLIHERKLALMVVRNEDPYFHIPRVKNLAHRLGILLGGGYLLNLDIDNFLTVGELSLLAALAEMGIGYHGFGKWFDGSFGRIGLPGELFLAAGAYPEYAGYAGKHDRILVQEMRRRTTVHRYPPRREAIQNDKSDTVKYSPLSKEEFVDHLQGRTQQQRTEIATYSLRGELRYGFGRMMVEV